MATEKSPILDTATLFWLKIQRGKVKAALDHYNQLIALAEWARDQAAIVIP